MNTPTQTPTGPNDDALQALRQGVLAMPMAQTLGLAFEALAPGQVSLSAPVQPGWCFAPGQLQATAMFALADFAAVAAAGTLLPPGWVNSTVDASVKFVAPGRGQRLLAHGRVVRAGRTLTVCAADVYAVDGERHTLCATWLGTARNHALGERG